METAQRLPVNSDGTLGDRLDGFRPFEKNVLELLGVDACKDTGKDVMGGDA